MTQRTKVLLLATATVAVAGLARAQWPAPVAPAIPEADGYVAIPQAAIPPSPARTYRAVFDATRVADDPKQLLPAVNMAGSELNLLVAAKVPLKNAKFTLVFHGPAVDGILDDAHYKAKYGIANPNLKVLAEFKKAGVELYVCGQHLAFTGIDPKTISPDVTVASDALIVLMTYQSNGYALMSF